MTLPDRHETGRAVAIFIAAAAPVVMAAAQARVIYDRVDKVHPSWPPWASVAMAVGFELAILTTGLALIVAGHRDRKLVAGEVFLIAMSVLVAVTTVLPEAWAVVLPLTIALVPVQYAVAFYAAHTLYTHWYQPAPATAPVAASEPRTPELAPVSAPLAHAPLALAGASVNGNGAGTGAWVTGRETRTERPTPKAKTASPRPSGQSVTVTAADYPERFAAVAREHILEAMPAGQADQLVGAAAGVSAKTVQRGRLAAG